MPAPTDLTWQQLQDAFANAHPGVDVECLQLQPVDSNNPNGAKTLSLNITAITNMTVQDFSDAGVVKSLIMLLELARAAQEKLNEGKLAGERLAAFPAATLGAQANGFVPISRTISARYELASAVRIVAVTA